MEKQQFQIGAYGFIEKIAAPISNTAHVYVPKLWAGKKVVVILVEKIED